MALPALGAVSAVLGAHFGWKAFGLRPRRTGAGVERHWDVWGLSSHRLFSQNTEQPAHHIFSFSESRN